MHRYSRRCIVLSQAAWLTFSQLGKLTFQEAFFTQCSIFCMKLNPLMFLVIMSYVIISRQLWAPGRTSKPKEKQCGGLSVTPTMSCTKNLFSTAWTAWKLNWSITRSVCTDMCVCVYVHIVYALSLLMKYIGFFLACRSFSRRLRSVLCEQSSSWRKQQIFSLVQRITLFCCSRPSPPEKQSHNFTTTSTRSMSYPKPPLISLMSIIIYFTDM